MQFTYSAYQNLIHKLLDSNYVIADYHNWQTTEKCAILRHDVDYDLAMSVKLAELEQELGVHSTYFVMLTNEN